MSLNTDRPKAAIVAAGAFHDHCVPIALCCAEAQGDEVVVTEADGAGRFVGVQRVRRSQLKDWLGTRDRHGFHLVFGPKVDMEVVEKRCMTMGVQAYRRWKATTRWHRNHPNDPIEPEG